MPLQEIPRADAFATGQLQVQQLQRLLPAGDDEAAAVGPQHLSRRAGLVDHPRAPDLQALAGDVRRAARERVEGAHAALQRLGAQTPVDRRFGLVDLVGVGDALVGLPARVQAALLGQRQRLHDQPRALRRQAVVQRRGGVVGTDLAGLGEQHVTGVEAGIHLHDGDAGAGVAGLDGAVDRCCAAPARQQRAVDVDAALRRQRQQPGRQDEAVGGHHQRLRRRLLQRSLRGAGIVGELAVQAQAARLRQRQAMVQRPLLDRRSLQLEAAAGRAVGLGQHQRQLVAGLVQRLQRCAREFRRAGKGQLHAALTCRAARRASS